MNLKDILTGNITASNIEAIVKTAKATFSETNHETSKGEGRTGIYNFFKEHFGEIKETLQIPDNKGGMKPKYAVLKKFLIGEKIFKDSGHYDRALVSINHFNRATVKAEKAGLELVAKQEKQAEYEALETDEARAEWVKQDFLDNCGKEADAKQVKREKVRGNVNKAISCLTDLDNLRHLHREDVKGLELMLETVKSYTKEITTINRQESEG